MKPSIFTISETVTRFAGHRVTVASAFAVALIWCIFGAAIGLPTEWSLLSNMIGTLTTLFVLLLMQQSPALQVKVDELIRSSEAGDHMIGIERLEADELSRLVEERQAGV
ncbi:low affinity iron permease family protein [Rhizobium sp. S152]|uniref:low affinity iron permease family protein n=1 Tax=Rhizobium sp. S152 TaxID=3055038 RepID=UPI0025AA1804|nr:low affinity iron permease family protein [Rhizobium sp. S152]MDM9627722.1 low affinity iron permease family protein [Rhizobium sp. S152]